MFQRNHTSKVRLDQYKNLRLLWFYVHSCSGFVIIVFHSQQIKKMIIPLFGRFIGGMDPNPVLMGVTGEKSTHYYDLYNFTPKKTNIRHTPWNTLCLRLQFMLTMTVLIPDKNNCHLQNAHFLKEIKNYHLPNICMYFFAWAKQNIHVIHQTGTRIISHSKLSWLRQFLNKKDSLHLGVWQSIVKNHSTWNVWCFKYEWK